MQNLVKIFLVFSRLNNYSVENANPNIKVQLMLWGMPTWNYLVLCITLYNVSKFEPCKRPLRIFSPLQCKYSRNWKKFEFFLKKSPVWYSIDVAPVVPRHHVKKNLFTISSLIAPRGSKLMALWRAEIFPNEVKNHSIATTNGYHFLKSMGQNN